MKIVDNWKDVPKHISTICMGIYGAAILAFNLLPPQMQASFDQAELRWSSLILMIIGIAGKYVDQSTKDSDHV